MSPFAILQALSDGLTVGVCCQKVIEAEAMAAYGITNILLSNQVVDDTKIARLAALCRGGAAISVLVDSADNAHQLARIAKSHGTTFGVLIEVDVGQHRCGVPSVSTAVDLARVVHGHTELRLQGIQAYHGAAQHARSLSERRSIGKLRVRAYLYDTLQCLRATRSLSPHELTETARLEHQQLRILVVGCLLCPCS
jgi:D-serine deaminase-like pyridoxal phosphate-dependent protein